MYRCLILLTTVLLLAGCHKKEVTEETKETYVDTVQCSFNTYDDTFSFALDDNEHFLSLTDTEAVVVTDDNKSVYVDYIEGNSLNDFEKAYKTSTGNENCMFLKSGSNDYLMIKYEADSKDLAEDIMQRVAVKEKNNE